MTMILDHFHAGEKFMPATARDLFALRLAQKLGEPSLASHYAALADQYPESQILVAYRRTIRNPRGPDMARRFHDELRSTQFHSLSGAGASLLSVRVERRTIAATVFNGENLNYADSRQLSSSNDKALISAAGFVNWLLSRFRVDSAALEAIGRDEEFQRRALHDAISETLRAHDLPIWEIPRKALLEACGHPPLRSRKELRAIARSVWPVLEGTHAKVFIQDAAILGLHAQIERHFILN